MIPARQRRRPRAGLAALVAAGLLLPAAAALARGGAYRESAHGDPATGVLRAPGLRRGECANCHGTPAPERRRQAGAGRGHRALFAPNDNGLCLTCHRRPGAGGSWLGDGRWLRSGHATSPAMVWPGPVPPGRPAAAAGLCLNCHDPHGVRDAQGLVPHGLQVRGAALCTACHAGAVGPDVATALGQPFRHPLWPDGGAPASPADGTCGACHDPHAAQADAREARPPAASRTLQGVARVRVANGAAGEAATLSPVPSGDQTAAREYEVCFKCHAGQGPARARADLSVLLNPANASYHPVEAPSRAFPLDRRAFTATSGPGRQVACADCHSAPAGQGRGPHGSSVPHILKRPFNATLAAQPATEGDLCFDCHAFATYASGAGAAGALSRYPGHGGHAARGLSCFACHDAHGSPQLPALLRLRPGALTAFAPDPAGAGGTCTTACHLSAPPVASYRR